MGQDFLSLDAGSNRGQSVSPTNPVPVAFQGAASAGTDRSTTAGASSTALMPANTARKGFYVKNDSATDVWINPGATATAAAGSGNIKVPANGGYYESPPNTPCSAAINIITTSGTAAITAREF